MGVLFGGVSPVSSVVPSSFFLSRPWPPPSAPCGSLSPAMGLVSKPGRDSYRNIDGSSSSLTDGSLFFCCIRCCDCCSRCCPKCCCCACCWKGKEDGIAEVLYGDEIPCIPVCCSWCCIGCCCENPPLPPSTPPIRRTTGVGCSGSLPRRSPGALPYPPAPMAPTPPGSIASPVSSRRAPGPP